MKHENTPQNKHEEFEKFVASRGKMTVEEQNLEAGLLIERIDSINTDRAFKKVHRLIDGRVVSISWTQQFRKYAAILIVPLFLALSYSVYLNFSPAKNDSVTYELTCPVGIRTQAVLPDGTKVWLNAKSSIKYQLPFVQKERNIKLSGEAFFEVTKNQKSPFIIESQNSFVKVLGTKFNVKSYPEDDEIAVALQEGSVDFKTINSENKTIQSILKPSEYLVYKKTDKSLSVSNKNIERFTSWRQNRLTLDETPINEVAVLLERWYGIQVEIVDKELMNYKFTTTFENESLSQVLELLEISSPVRIKYVPVKSGSEADGNLSAKVYFYKK